MLLTDEQMQTRAQALLDGTVILMFNLSAIGNKKQVDPGIVDTDADKGSLSLHKTLMESEELKACMTLMRETRDKIKRRSVPSFLQRGAHLVKLEAIKAIETLIQGDEYKLSLLVDNLITALPDIKEEARGRLKSMYNEADYPDEKEIRAAITMKWRWFEIATPDRMQSISPRIWAAEREKAQTDLQDAVVELTALLREEFSTMVSHLSERLTPDPDGKPKRFFESSVTNLEEFCDLFDLRNVAGDVELRAKVEQARRLISGVSVPGIKKDVDGQYRSSLSTEFGKIATAVKALPVVTGRRIQLDDDDQ